MRERERIHSLTDGGSGAGMKMLREAFNPVSSSAMAWQYSRATILRFTSHTSGLVAKVLARAKLIKRARALCTCSVGRRCMAHEVRHMGETPGKKKSHVLPAQYEAHPGADGCHDNPVPPQQG